MGIVGLDNVGSGYSRKGDMHHRVHHHEHEHKEHAKDHDKSAPNAEQEIQDQDKSSSPDR